MRGSAVCCCLTLLLFIASCKEEDPVSVILDSTSVQDITNTTATVRSQITGAEGNATADEHGHCWGLQAGPDISGDHSSLGSIASGNFFSSSLAGLEPGMPYYVRPYAIVGGTTIYGAEVSFSTAAFAQVVTAEATLVTESGALVGGHILSDAGNTITACGICWNTSPGPTLDNHVVYGTAGTTDFACEMTDLAKSTIYFVRAFATNSSGTAYGQQVEFITLPVVFTEGQYWQGGIIFHVDSTGLHGLISATTDQGKAAWGCNETFLGGTETGIGTGKANTELIATGCSESSTAARLCRDMILNGYSDWFLPSKDELYLMYEQRSVIGGFKEDNYWSSSESSATFAYRLYMPWGYYNSEAYKNFAVWVRAVRAF